MERHWGIKLPQWIHEFYSQMSEAVFLWRNLIRVMPPLEVIRNEDEQRSWDGGGGLPIRLIRFAVLWLTGSHLALRQSAKDDQWRIMYVSEYDTTEECQDASQDEYDEDENIQEWLARMMATDGFPICRNQEEHERLFVHRVA